MKAYKISTEVGDVPDIIVYSDTRNHARLTAIKENEWYEEYEYMGVTAKRAKWADDKENLSEGELIKLSLANGWHYYLEYREDNEYVTEEDLDTINKYPSFDDFVDDWLKGNVKTYAEMEDELSAWSIQIACEMLGYADLSEVDPEDYVDIFELADTLEG